MGRDSETQRGTSGCRGEAETLEQEYKKVGSSLMGRAKPRGASRGGVYEQAPALAIGDSWVAASCVGGSETYSQSRRACLPGCHASQEYGEGSKSWPAEASATND